MAFIQIASGTGGYLEEGTHAARPAAPLVPTGGISFYYETDTGAIFIWDSGGTAWVQIGGGTPAGISALLDSLGSTQGDILYRNATVWTVLAPGTAGQRLTTGGAGANPSWSSAATTADNWVTKTANYSVQTTDAGTDFVTTGAAGTVNFSLPAGATNLLYGFLVDAAHTLQITANGTDTITMQDSGGATSAGGNFTSNTPGNYMRISCFKTGAWIVKSALGVWTPA